MSALGRLTGAAYGVHFADQIALVSVPLIAALVFQAPAEVIGLLVACQSLAHLVGSIPFGILVDNAQQRTLAIGATLISFVGFSGAASAVFLHNLFWFGVCVTFAGFGVVLFTLTTLSILPKAVASKELASANARIELPRAFNSFAVPLGVGMVISGASANLIFPVAALGGVAALVCTFGLPDFEVQREPKRKNLLFGIFEGGKFVLQHDLLRAISLCAIFWNFAFSALLVTMVPLIRDVFLADAGTFGIALAAFGMGAICGSWASRRFSGQMPPNIVLLFGPAISTLAALVLYLIPANGPVLAVYSAFLLLGFGPSMWLIAQNSVRQIVSPRNMLGRVNAVIQTTIYGIRPLGALIAGTVVGATSPEVGLSLVLGGFGLSLLAAAFSGLRQIRSYADLEATDAR